MTVHHEAEPRGGTPRYPALMDALRNRVANGSVCKSCNRFDRGSLWSETQIDEWMD